MPSQPIVLRLPEQLARRLKRQVPPRDRNRFVTRPIEQALRADSHDASREAALAAKQDAVLQADALG